MKLKAKIRSEYLDELLLGKKRAEYRQFETMELTDETGRSVVFDVCGLTPLSITEENDVKALFHHVPWEKGKRIYKLWLRKLNDPSRSRPPASGGV